VNAFAAAVVLGALTGLHAATWGAYKDSPFEGFRVRSFLRSVAAGCIASLGFAVWSSPASGRPSLLVTVGVVYSLERLATEWWKAFVREDDQTAYSIPMRVAVGGRPIDRWQTRGVVGIGIVAILVGGGLAAAEVEEALARTASWGVVIAVGGLGGLATAVGGAWKDAPIEGFSGWKFLRSPVVATLWAIPVSLLTTHLFLVVLSAGGLSVASIETYKSFFTGGRPPGKFASKPVVHRLPAVRRRLGSIHAGLWGLFGIALVASLSESPGSTTAKALSAVSPHLPVAVLGSVAVLAGVSAGLISGRNRRLTQPRDAAIDSPNAYVT
jgi:hypothetical protein